MAPLAAIVLVVLTVHLTFSMEAVDVKCGPGYIIEPASDGNGFKCSLCPDGTYNTKINNDRCELCTSVYAKDPYVKVVTPCRPDQDTVLECREPDKMYRDGKTCKFFLPSERNQDSDAGNDRDRAEPGVSVEPVNGGESQTTSQNEDAGRIELTTDTQRNNHVDTVPRESEPTQGDTVSRESEPTKKREWGYGSALNVFMMAAVVSAFIAAFVNENHR